MNRFWCLYVPRFTVIFFLVSICIAMLLYPGGNHLETEQIGYSLSKNFISELGRFKTMSGDNNFFSAFLFIIASFINVLQGIAFLFIAKLFHQNKISYVFAIIGGICIFIGNLFFVGVCLTPEDLFFDEHIFVAQNGFNFASLGIFSLSIAVILSRMKNIYALISVVLMILLVIYSTTVGHIPEINPSDSVLYANTYSMDTQIFKVIMQKLIVATLMMFVFTFTFGLNALIKKS